jgi:hypothetical protein
MDMTRQLAFADWRSSKAVALRLIALVLFFVAAFGSSPFESGQHQASAEMFSAIAQAHPSSPAPQDTCLICHVQCGCHVQSLPEWQMFRVSRSESRQLVAFANDGSFPSNIPPRLTKPPRA